MKKQRFPAFFLALALCLGLAVPAFAADTDALSEIRIYLVTPENSGIIPETQELDAKLSVDFGRSGSDNSHITYAPAPLGLPVGVQATLVPKGMDLLVTGLSSADEVMLKALSSVDVEEGFFSGYTCLFSRLFTWESGEDLSLVPLVTGDPMNFEYDDPMDGKTHVAGNIAATDAGFQANENGDVLIDSERLYELLDEGDFLQIMIVSGDDLWVNMYRLSGEPLLVSDVFTDVDTGNWVSDPVAWALMNDITTGTSETRFSPSNNCTQAQILTFLYRAAREEQVESSAKDMELAIQWAQEKGMIDDSFDGSTPCTRATAVSYIWQAFNKPAAGAPASFTDVDDNASFAGAVSWAVEKKITNGANADGSMFLPDKICNRGEIVTFLYRAYNN